MVNQFWVETLASWLSVARGNLIHSGKTNKKRESGEFLSAFNQGYCLSLLRDYCLAVNCLVLSPQNDTACLRATGWQHLRKIKHQDDCSSWFRAYPALIKLLCRAHCVSVSVPVPEAQDEAAGPSPSGEEATQGKGRAISATENVTAHQGQCQTDLFFLSAQSLPFSWAELARPRVL